MPDYDHPLRFGIFPSPRADSAQETLQMARVADEAGFDLVGIQDHPYQRRFLDTWTLMGFVLARTSRVTVFPDVANLPLRPPRMMAKAAASLDLLSDGRFELGLGAGAFWEGIEAMGGRALSPRQSVDALEQAIVEMRDYWKAEGKFEGPPPAHEIGIWVGAYRPRMLRITGALANGWIPSQSYLPPEQVPEAMKRIDDAAAAEGRDPHEIRRVYNLIGEGEPDAGQIADFASGLGFDSFIFSPSSVKDIERLAHDVIPAVKEEVSRRRDRDGQPR
jgi:alkanesulfonate monooxygenase SsuD/methylene tetrahydromethanopterin reductase-like flavin-dependent oxidoreductase (luciferase family)